MRLDRAAAILDGTIQVPVEQRVVAAAHLARSGLELAVVEVLLRNAIDLRRARMTSRLTVLGALVGADLGARTRLAWTELSLACHRHAFELPPAETQVRVAISNVRGVLDRLRPDNA